MRARVKHGQTVTCRHTMGYEIVVSEGVAAQRERGRGEGEGGREKGEGEGDGESGRGEGERGRETRELYSDEHYVFSNRDTF